MRVQRVIRYTLSFYIWGFITYQLLPMQIIPYTNYAPAEFYPRPVVYRYTFAYDVKTAFSNHAGSIKNLLKALEEKKFDIAFGDFPENLENRLFPTPQNKDCLVLRTSDIPLSEELLHTLFERVPKLLIGRSPEDILTRKIYRKPHNCYLVAHDDRILLSTFFGFDFPSYDYILGNRRNVYTSKDILLREAYVDDFLKGALVVFGDADAKVFAYSEMSFYLPGGRTTYSFRYVVDSNVKNPLVMLFHNGDLKGIYEQNRINMPVSERGKYTAHVLTYKAKVYVFYLGLRSIALASPIELTD
ncbi:hypothetical protein BCF55_0586 [Hydrogenivirga caldilitoris]|uniref:Uncharacterized protein n=1 Tax=Hydrogenivirga caldilitoris TaxID=246264 RepID=A0A497XN81_9AQUI|nr:hypothetical protein [Hydrogenivirga caldilitoris]RLJ70318.1 hypothetical protein BCF55_0586 [Hydrogenivirga caldilitoris]